MHADRARSERCLARLRAEVDDPVAGLFGPGSAMWRIASEKVVFVGGGAAALLQLAHPFVGEAVARHSAAMTDPLGRFERTFRAVYDMAFGDVPHAFEAARRVHGVHEGIHGAMGVDAGRYRSTDRYDARDLPATQWVHATLVHGSVQAWEIVLGPLEPDVKEQYWAESRTFGLLFGLWPEELPESWTAFEAWWRDVCTSDALAVTPSAAKVGRKLLEPPHAGVAPIYRAYAAVTSALLPPRLREPFGLTWTVGDRALAAASFQAARAGYPLVPSRIRRVPASHEARRRMHGGRSPDRLGRAFERVVLNAFFGLPAASGAQTR